MEHPTEDHVGGHVEDHMEDQIEKCMEGHAGDRIIWSIMWRITWRIICRIMWRVIGQWFDTTNVNEAAVGLTLRILVQQKCKHGSTSIVLRYIYGTGDDHKVTTQLLWPFSPGPNSSVVTL